MSAFDPLRTPKQPSSASMKPREFQWKNRQLDEEHWRTIERRAADFRQYPGVRKAWDLRSHWYSAEFRDWFEALTAAREH